MGFWNLFRRKKHKKIIPEPIRRRKIDPSDIDPDNVEPFKLEAEMVKLEYWSLYLFYHDLRLDWMLRTKCEKLAEMRKKRGLRYIR